MFGTMMVLMAAGGWAIYAVMEHRLTAEFDHFLTDKLRFLEASAFQKGERIAFLMPRAALKRIQDPNDPEFFQFRYRTGETFFRSRSLNGLDLPALGMSQAPIGPMLGEATLQDVGTVRCAGASYFPINPDGTRSEILVNVVVAHRSDHIAATLAEFRGVIVSVGSISTIVLLGIAWFFSKISLSPLNDLTDQIASIPPGGGERFSLENPPAELSPVVDRLNELKGRFDVALDHERQFASNAAHELRTPLAVMKIELEYALKKGRTDEQYRQAIRRALSAEQNLESAVENLLWLTRLESNLDSISLSKIRVGAFMRTHWKPHLEKADARDLKVTWDVKAAPSVMTSGDLLGLALRNLYENAVTYTPTGGSITIAGHNGGPNGEATLRVTNSNPGLEEADIESLFQRHWRNSERQFHGANKQEDGTLHLGIGLSLTRQVAETLGGRIQAHITAQNEVSISLCVNNLSRKREKTCN